MVVGKQLRVLEAVRAPDGTTRFVDQVVAHPGPDIRFAFIAPARFIRLDYDVVHFHWPEMLVRHRNAVIEQFKACAFDIWLWRLKRRGIGIVRTLHNVTPHETVRPAVRRSLARLAAMTDVTVALNPATPLDESGTLILHGHYRDRFDGHDRPTTRPGRIIYAGLIRPYKGVESLVRAFGDVHVDGVQLRIVGKPTDELRTYLNGVTSADPARISTVLEFVSDEQLVAEISQAELVCLPYQELHNSGILLVALSLDRPVLVPRTAATEALQDEVGPGWIVMFEGEITADDIERALREISVPGRAARPALSERDWGVVGRRYSEVFRAAHERARASSRLR
jgi:beta-1,4-mannosyltransferase